MNTCAFLTMSDLDGFVVDDDLAIPPLSDLGWSVAYVPWRSVVDWDAFDAVVIRSTWDYMEAPVRFLEVLQSIEDSSATLMNELDLVSWNLEKTYLKRLAAHGIDVVPSRWGCGLSRFDMEAAFDEFSTDEVVLKPVVGANALDTFRVKRATLPEQEPSLVRSYAARDFLLQPFVPAILEEGEHSLIFFNGAFSHAIQKQPKEQDFRVQEEHGASVRPVRPTDPQLSAAARALDALPEPPLYARVDLVRFDSGYALMELELIEPSLYLRFDPLAPARFAHALDRRMSGIGPELP